MLHLYHYLKTLSAAFTLLIIISSISLQAISQPIRYDSLTDFNNRIINDILFTTNNNLVIVGNGTQGADGSYFGVYDTSSSYSKIAEDFYFDWQCIFTNNEFHDVLEHPENGYIASMTFKECGFYEIGLVWFDQNGSQLKRSTVPSSVFHPKYGEYPFFSDILIRESDKHILGILNFESSSPNYDTLVNHSIIIEFDDELNFVQSTAEDLLFPNHYLELKQLNNKVFVFGKELKSPEQYYSKGYIAEVDINTLNITQEKVFEFNEGSITDLTEWNQNITLSISYAKNDSTLTSSLIEILPSNVNHELRRLDLPMNSGAREVISHINFLNDDFGIVFSSQTDYSPTEGLENIIRLFSSRNFEFLDSISINMNLEKGVTKTLLNNQGLYFLIPRTETTSSFNNAITELLFLRTQSIVSTGDLSFSTSELVNLYPNPVQEGNTLTLNHVLKLPSETNIEVYDLEGRLLQSSILPHNSQSTEFRVDYPSGVYIIHLRSGSRIHATKKLIIQ